MAVHGVIFSYFGPLNWSRDLVNDWKIKCPPENKVLAQRQREIG